MWSLEKKLYQFVHKRFGHISQARLGRMAKKGIMKGLPKNPLIGRELTYPTLN